MESGKAVHLVTKTDKLRAPLSFLYAIFPPQSWNLESISYDLHFTNEKTEGQKAFMTPLNVSSPEDKTSYKMEAF